MTNIRRVVLRRDCRSGHGLPDLLHAQSASLHLAASTASGHRSAASPPASASPPDQGSSTTSTAPILTSAISRSASSVWEPSAPRSPVAPWRSRCRVVAIDPVQTSLPGVESVWPVELLPRLLGESDFVVIAAPHTPQTERMMKREQFQQMKKTAYVVNIGRGAIVALDDLVAALKQARSPERLSMSLRQNRCQRIPRYGGWAIGSFSHRTSRVIRRAHCRTALAGVARQRATFCRGRASGKRRQQGTLVLGGKN